MIRTSFNRGWTATETKTGIAGLSGVGAGPRAVTLPHDIVRDLDRSADTVEGSHTGYFPGGYFEYAKTFDVPNSWRDRTVLLEFEGVYRDATVRVNRDLAGSRPNGYAGFTVDLAPYLLFGQPNTITVSSWAHEDSRWYTGAGIYRDTWLHVSGLVHVEHDGVRVTTPELDAAIAVVEAAITIRNDSRATRTVRVMTQVLDPAGGAVASATSPVTVPPGTSETARLRHFVREPALWSVDSPSMHRLRTVVVDGEAMLDEQETAFGIRSLRLDPVHGLRINGETVKLRGACIHHDNGPLGSAAITRAEERRVEVLKSAGYNAIRSAHNPVSRATLDACDRLGMLVMDEFTDMWTSPKASFDYSHSFAEWYERDIAAMVAKDFNHPSVVLYSIGNEIAEVGRPLGSRWGRVLAETVRANDSTRYVTNAVNLLLAVTDSFSNESPAGDFDVNAFIANIGQQMSLISSRPTATERTEESFAVLDVAGINYGESRYDLDRDLFPNRVMVGSETFPGHLDVLWPLVQGNGHVIGDFAWTGWDYIGEASIGRQYHQEDLDAPVGSASPYPWMTANCGTIDITGHRRPISYWREIVWGRRNTPYMTVVRPENHVKTPVVSPWSWLESVPSWTWDVPPGSPVTVEVYSDADEVELLVNGQPVGRGAVGTEKACLVRFETLYTPGEIVAVAYTDSIEQARTALWTASGDVRVVATVDRADIRADDTDLSYIDVVLQDSAGNLASHIDRTISVQIDGPGELAGLGSGRPDTTERFDASSCTTYDGHALAIIRPTGIGEILVRVAVEGIGASTVYIRSLLDEAAAGTVREDDVMEAQR